MFHNFRGKRYKIKFLSPKQLKKDYGQADNPKRKNKSVRLRTDLNPKIELTVAIHEAFHCCQWDMSEEAVHESSTDIAEFLWRLGYRKVKE